MFEVKGEHSQKAAEALRARFEHRVTRVDACADFDAPGAFEALLAPSIEVKKERRIMGGKAGDWDDFPRRAGLCTWAARAALFVCVSTKRAFSPNMRT